MTATALRYTYTGRHRAPRQPISAAVLGVLLATVGILLSLLAGMGTAQAVHPIESADTCARLDANDLTDEELAEVLHLGFRGSPSDGGEWLYAPDCLPADAQLMAQDGPTGCYYVEVPHLSDDEWSSFLASGWVVWAYEDGSAHVVDPTCVPSFA